MPRRAARRARRWPEFGTGFAGVGRLDDPAVVAEWFLGQSGAGTEGQGFGAVHFVEVGFVDFRRS